MRLQHCFYLFAFLSHSFPESTLTFTHPMCAALNKCNKTRITVYTRPRSPLEISNQAQQGTHMQPLPCEQELGIQPPTLSVMGNH